MAGWLEGHCKVLTCKLTCLPADMDSSHKHPACCYVTWHLPFLLIDIKGLRDECVCVCVCVRKFAERRCTALAILSPARIAALVLYFRSGLNV